MHIKIEREFGPQVIALLTEHLVSMSALSPPQSVHALDIAGLQIPEVTFWCAWNHDRLMGCGAMKELVREQSSVPSVLRGALPSALPSAAHEVKHGEIKSMRTVAAYLRQGVAASILAQLIAVAKQRRFHQLSLETGSAIAFMPARSLYERYGFEECEPFAEYVPDPYSTFMTLRL